ncbi:uncharacterized protein LOC125847242 [Solanum stenotomum]|uniref:uncharacterized protein LOC125847242 n=1 Tax=Solanum stenotomum TaxID=172797 RepID=UPI0020D17B06|nr:uncharacterized protein LOC125847242 [Solanum stenotomum]
MASRLRDFTRMNPSTFLGSKVNEDPQGFLEKVYKIVEAMGVSSNEKVELAGLMVHAQQVEESRLRKRNREVKRPRADEGNATNGKFEGQGEPRFKKSCGKSGHVRRDCPMLKVQGRENKQAQASGSNSDAPKKNHFYSLQSRGDQQSSPNVVTVSSEGIEVDPKKIETVKKWPRPLSPTDIISFLD